MKHCHYFSFLSKNLHIHLWGSYGNPLTCCFLFINPPAVHSNEPKGNISLLSHHLVYNSKLWVSCPNFLILTFSRCSARQKKAVQWRKVCNIIQSFAFCLKNQHCRPAIVMHCIFQHIQNLITCTFHDHIVQSLP